MKNIIKKISVMGAVALIAAVTAAIAPPAAASGPPTPVTMACAPAANSTLIGLPNDHYALDNDVTGCTANGIVLDGGGYTFDLAGREVSCFDGTAGDGWAIRIRGAAITIIDSGHPVTGAKGVVRYCDVGIKMDASGVISGGNGGNTIDGITITMNRGDQCRTTDGEGVLIDTSSANTVVNNTITHNGPFSGITVLGNSVGNTIKDNTVSDNDWAVKCTNLAGTMFHYFEVAGIRVEGHGRGNTISGNSVDRNGLDGIALFPLSNGNIVKNNVSVNDNGTLTLPPASPYPSVSANRGDGIKVFNLATDNVVEANTTVCGNQGNGIYGGAGTNIFQGNVSGQGTACNNNVGGGARWDLNDNNSPVGSPDVCVNVWVDNSGDTANKPCTQGP